MCTYRQFGNHWRFLSNQGKRALPSTRFVSLVPFIDICDKLGMARYGSEREREPPEIPGAKIATLTRPPRWTQVYSWKLAGFSLTDPDQHNSDSVRSLPEDAVGGL